MTTNPDNFDFDLPDLPLDDNDSDPPRDEAVDNPAATAPAPQHDLVEDSGQVAPDQADDPVLPELPELEEPEEFAVPSIADVIEEEIADEEIAPPIEQAAGLPTVNEPAAVEPTPSVEATADQAVVAAQEPEPTPSIEPAIEPGQMGELPADPGPAAVDQASDEPAFVPDPEHIHVQPVVRSRMPLIIGGSVAAVLAIGIAAFVFWPDATPEATPTPVVSQPAEQPVVSDPVPTPEPVIEPATEVSTPDLGGDVLSAPDQSVEAELEPAAPAKVEPTPAAVAQPKGTAKPAPVAGKPTPKPVPKPTPKKEPEPSWQDEALNALDAFEKGL